jgi:hypothetical protein
MAPRKKKPKLQEQDDNEAEDLTQRLPEEILLKIFRYVRNMQPSNYWIHGHKIDNILLTCKRWNYIMSSHYVFHQSRFLEVERPEDEKNIVKNSLKKFRRLVYYVHKGDYELFNVLAQRSAKCLNFTELLFHTLKVPESRLHSMLFQITNVTELELSFYGAEMEIVPEDFAKKMMSFPSLEKLKVYVYHLKFFYMISHFMKSMEVPKLKKLECGGSQPFLPICENFFGMATRSLETLEEVHFRFGCAYNFLWNRNTRHADITYCEKIEDEIIDFLKPLAKDLIKVGAQSQEGKLYSFLLTECVNMEYISSDLDFKDLSKNFHLPKCHRVEIHHTEWNQPKIYKLHQTFPNARILRFHHVSGLSSEEKRLIRLLFTKLRVAECYDFDTGWVKF